MPRNLKISQEEAKHLTIEKVKGTVCQFDFVELKVQDQRSNQGFIGFIRILDTWNLKLETWRSQT